MMVALVRFLTMNSLDAKVSTCIEPRRCCTESAKDLDCSYKSHDVRSEVVDIVDEECQLSNYGYVNVYLITVRWVSTVPYRNWYDTIVPFTKIACTLYDNVRPSSDRCSPPHLSLVQPHVESRALDSHGLILP